MAYCSMESEDFDYPVFISGYYLEGNHNSDFYMARLFWLFLKALLKRKHFPSLYVLLESCL